MTNRVFKRAESLKVIGNEVEGGRLTLEQVIAKIRTRVLARQPFWGTLLTPIQIRVTEIPDIKTAATDGEHIFFDKTFLCNMTYGEAAYVLAHEGMHIAMVHLHRLFARNPRLWNIACDHFINLILDAEADRAPEVFSKPDFPRITGKKGSRYFNDPRFTDLAAETIYSILMKEQYMDSPEMESDSEENGFGEDLDYSQAGTSNETQEEKAKRLEEMWSKRLAQAAEAGREAGNMPGHIKRWIDAMAVPKVDWQTLLASYVAFNPSDYEFTHPDRRFSDWPFIVPDLAGDKLVAAAAIDTSGSISDEMIKEFISELYNILAVFDHVDGVLIGHDHEVHDVIEFTKAEPPDGFSGGGGGTDFHCVTAELEKRDVKPVVLIWFTDLYAPFPDDPGYPVIFVAVDTPLDGPSWAHTIHLDTQ